MSTIQTETQRMTPVLLYDGGCATCSRIARWVNWAAGDRPPITVRPVGDDPAELHRLNPGLDIWDAYAVSHVIMPDGSMKLGGEAVAEVFRCLPATRWFAPCFDFKVFGGRPIQAMLDLAYRVLDDIRPIFGCESCGRSKAWVRPFAWLTRQRAGSGAKGPQSRQPLHFRPLPAGHFRPLPARQFMPVPAGPDGPA